MNYSCDFTISSMIDYMQHNIRNGMKKSESKAVNLNLIFLSKFDTNQEFTNVLPLVSLQLNNLTILAVVHYCPVACKLLYRGRKTRRVDRD